MDGRICRVGAVSYLNTLPLVHGLDPHRDRIDLHFDLPGRLADRLAAADLDVALIPTIEVFRSPDYRVVSDACIGCRGPVWSVKLLSHCPPGQIRTLALDEGSRTSVALVRILLDQEFGFQPEFQPLPIDADWHHEPCDAVMIIGDRAMCEQSTDLFPVQIDLGQWWYERTGLPFVFAMWTARPGLPAAEMDRVGRVLSRCRDHGVANAAAIAGEQAARFGLGVDQCTNYFTRFLHFKLEARERTGLSRFRTLAGGLGLVAGNQELQFHA